MKNNRLISLIVFLSFLFPVLGCSLAGDISAQKTASPTTASAQTGSLQGATPISTAAISNTGGATPAQTAAPTPASIPAGTLEITSLSSYKDLGGNFHVAGEVLNQDSKPLTSIVLTLTIQDASGKSLLSDSSGGRVDSLSISPLLSTLLPGKAAPFDYLLSSNAGVPNKYDVKVSGAQPGDMQSAALAIQNAQMITGTNGLVYLTGEIVNKGGEPLQIYNLAGSLLDKDKKVIAAASTNNYSTYLSGWRQKPGRPYAVFDRHR